MSRTVALLICGGALLLPAALLAQFSGAPAESSVVLRSGDAVLIDVWRRPDLSGEFSIGDDGSITHPLYRDLRVSSLPMSAVEEQLRAFLVQFDATPAFVIEPRLRVTLAGQIVRPNVYMLPARTTISQAITVAGGPTERGRLSDVQLVRDGRIMMVDLTRPDASITQMPIRSGDQIIVPRGRSVFREVVTPTLTAVGAVAAVVNVIMRAQR